MSTGFNFYEGTTTENTAPKITVRKGGQLVMTSGAVCMLGDDVGFVQIGFNAKTKEVGIRAASEGAQGRYRLRAQKNSENRLVTGRRFFSHNELSIDRARTYDAKQFDSGIVGFQLTEEPAEESPLETPAPKKASPRRKTKAAA